MNPPHTRLAMPALATALLFLLTSPTDAFIVITETSQDTDSVVQVAGVIVDEQYTDNMFGVSGSKAEHGSLLTSGARTAARSASNEIAANAQFAETTFGGFTDYNAFSQTEYDLTAQNQFNTGHDVMLDFFLPPTLLEIHGNLESGPVLTKPLTARVSAHLTVFTPSELEFFNFLAELTGSYVTGMNGTRLEWSLTDHASVGFDTDLDLSPLNNPTVTVIGEGEFETTVTVEYPSFSGQLMLGSVHSGGEIEVSYSMTAEVDGIAAGTTAIAAINDPFFLSTDPVTMAGFALPVDGGESVPEPATLALLAASLACIPRRREHPARAGR